MKIVKFEDCIAWVKSGELSVKIYIIFRESRDFGFRDQIQRASVSIMNNIAEGLERNTNNELRNFLYIAKGSAGEVRSMLYLGYKLNYLSSNEYSELISLVREISCVLSGLIKTL